MLFLCLASRSNNLVSNPAEYAPIDETYNPSIHRVNNAVKIRAAHPDKPVPETPATLLRFSSPPEDLIEKVQSRIDSLIEHAEVKKGRSSPVTYMPSRTNIPQFHPRQKVVEIGRRSSQYQDWTSMRCSATTKRARYHWRMPCQTLRMH